ncbi:Aldehyde dehydrogenase [Streptomyces misionensis JCM 4497]
MVGAARRRARQVPVPHRPDHPGAQPRTGRPGDAGQRQADQGDAGRRPPAGRGPLLLLRGLGRQARPRRLRREPAPAGRGGPGHPVELPAADAGVEDRPGAGDRQHGRPEARRDDPAVGAVLRGRLPSGGPAQGRRQHRDRCRAYRRGAGRAPGREQGRVHGLDGGRQGDRADRGRHAQEAHPRTGRQGREHRLRRRPDRPGRRGRRERHLLQPGPGLLRRFAPPRAGVGPGRAAGRAQAQAVHAAPGRPAGQEHRHRRDQLRRAAGPDHRAGREGRGGGCRALVPGLRTALLRLLVRADALHERHPGAHHRPRGDLRPGAVGPDLPHPGRGGRQGEQHAVRAVGGHLVREGLADPGGGEQAARGRDLVQHVQQVRPDLAVRRLQGVGLRPRGRPPRPGGVPRCLTHDFPSSRPTSCTWAASSRVPRAAGCTR